MNKDRIAILRRVFGDRFTEVNEALFTAAKTAKATVDDVIQAGLGRGSTPEGGRGAQHLKTFGFDFAPLDAVWPWCCPACLAYVPALSRCPECREPVCPACLGNFGCPDCTAKARARIEVGKVATAEQEANRKWLKRQLAEPVPKPVHVDPPMAEESLPPPRPPTPPEVVWPRDEDRRPDPLIHDGPFIAVPEETTEEVPPQDVSETPAERVE